MRNMSTIRALALVFIAFFAINIAMSSIIGNPGCNFKPTRTEISYGEFLTELNKGSIESITIYSTGKIEGAMGYPSGIKKLFKTYAINPDMNFVDSLAEKIKNSNSKAIVKTEKDNEYSAFYMFFYSWGPILVFFLLLYFLIIRPMRKGGGVEASSFINRAKPTLLKVKVKFEDVAGCDEAKAELAETVEFLQNPQKFTKIGAKIPKGLLLIGPPGTGKTLLARAVAGEADVPFFSMSGSGFVEMFVGVGAGRVRDLFEKAKKNSPCIVFIDEVDAVGRHRGTGIGGGHDEREQTLNQILNEMDGFEPNQGVVVIAATNRPDVLDPAFIRAGRFDRKVVVEKPDIRGRLEILKIHTRNQEIDNNVDLNIIARGTSGFAGSDLANLVNEAALRAARLNQEKITSDDFEYARDKVLMGTERSSKIVSPKEKNIIAVHEAGHALLTVLLEGPDTDPLHKVTIISRGMSGGSTHQLPDEDKGLYSKKYIENRLIVLMGGRLAEELILNEYTTGASSDIEVATELAESMVCRWGMSKLGTIKFGDDTEQPFLGKRISEGNKNYSEKTADLIDRTIKEIIDSAYKSAKKMLEENIDKLKTITEELKKQETLTGEQVKNIVIGQN